MAKSKAASDAILDLDFVRTGNPWIDAGIVGFYRILMGLPAYLDPPTAADDAERRGAFADVRYVLSTDRMTVSGPTDQVQACLEWAYDRLVSTYFDISSKKQKEDFHHYNFYYDSDSDRFIKFPKKKSIGAASLLFDKAVRPSGTQVAWIDKKNPGSLPPSHAHLQPRLDEFLAEHELKPGPPAGLLIDGENQVRPKVEIRAGSAGRPATCFLTGEPFSKLVEAKETAFPLLGGSRCFVNGGQARPRLGWQVDFVGKFVPALAFYYLQGDDIHVFFPQSNDLRRVDELAQGLAQMVSVEPNLFRNFEIATKLGGYFSRRSEVTLAFLHQVFVKLTEQQRPRRILLERAKAADGDKRPLFEDEPVDPDPEPHVSASDVFDATQRGGPIGFAVVSATKKGNVWMARDFRVFQDVVYLARLFDMMQRRIARSGKVVFACSPALFLRALVDHEASDQGRTLVRDRVCEAVLGRRPVLHLLERHAFHINTHSDLEKSRNIRPLLDFAGLYEVELREGTTMAEGYREMVETATWLGDTIGKAIAGKSKGEGGESRGKAKGALFRLRKTRTTADFVNELARLQLRYELEVPSKIFDGAMLTPGTFEEFRGFCVLSALNRFLQATRSESKPTAPNPK